MQQYSSRNVGIVSLVPMNGWNANIVYEKLNIVTHKNSTFIAKQKNRGIEPFVSSNWEDIWMPLISGVGIATAVVEYASTKITSPAPPESGWAEEMPELKPAEYVWTRVTITYTDGRKTIFYSVGAGGVPAKTSDLENDGEGTSPFATEKQLQAEKERAEAAEGANKTAIETETSRAKAAEQANAEAIQSESARAKAAESAEKTRAEGAEATEKARAEGAEAALGNRITTIENKIPEQASASNKLADQAFVNSSINALAAFFITPTATGDKAFTTRAALLSATTFYSGGKVRVPTQNDYAIVLADESQTQGVDGTYPTTRYSYQGGTYPNGQWDFQYIVNNTSLTQAQVTALNSGITAELVALITTNKNDIAAIKTKNSEQDASIASLTTRMGNVESKNSSQDEEIAAVKTIATDAMPKSGGAFTGQVSWNAASLPALDAPLYFVTIEPFASGGKMFYSSIAEARKGLGLATVATSGKYSDLLGLPTIPSAYTLPTATSTILGGVKLGSDTVQSVERNTTTKASGRTYAIQKNSAGQLVVNVPWADTTYDLSGYAKKSDIPSSLPPSGAAGGDLTGDYPNPSLSTALKNLINGALQKSGGVMSGDLQTPRLLTNSIGAPFYSPTNAIEFISGDNNSYGYMVRIGANGITIVGAGESSINAANAITNKNDENLYLLADGEVVIKANAESWGSGTEVKVTSTGLYENGQRVYSASNLPEHIKIEAGNESNIDYGFAGGALYLNYRGASSAITELRICDGMLKGALVPMVASDYKFSDNKSVLQKVDEKIQSAITTALNTPV